MAERKNSFGVGAGELDAFRKPRKLDIPIQEVERAGQESGFTRDTPAYSNQKLTLKNSTKRAPCKRPGEKRISVALSKNLHKWLAFHAIETDQSIQNIFETLVEDLRQKHGT